MMTLSPCLIFVVFAASVIQQNPVSGYFEECKIRTLVHTYVKFCNDIKIEDRVQCGQNGLSRSECNAEGCCYDAEQELTRCFHPSLKGGGERFYRAKREYSKAVGGRMTKYPKTEQEHFDRNAHVYNLINKMGLYNAPEHVSKVMADYYPSKTRSNIRILDVAAGNGLIGKYLNKLGFENIDALEPSQGMLFYLKKNNRNAYKNVFEVSIGNGQKTNIEKGSYDSIVCVEAMHLNLIPVEGVDDMIALVKPGGTIFVTNRIPSEVRDNQRRQYYSDLDTYLDKLVENGRLIKGEKKHFQDCYNGRPCVLYTFTTGTA